MEEYRHEYESKIYDGIEVRRTVEHFRVWGSADGRILGDGVWRKQSLTNNGRLVVGKTGSNNTAVFVYRIIAIAWLPNPDKLPQVDHLDGNLLNNNISNLRWCSPRQNQQNLKNHREKSGSSKFIGVAWHKRDNKWCAKIQINNKQKYLGTYTDEIEAAKAYDAALIELGLEPVNFK